MINQLFKVIIGLILILLAIWIITFSSWLAAIITLIKGSIIVAVFFIGLAIVIWGLIGIKED
jgi:hypothetical protein